MISKSDSYASAGVDVTAGYEAVNRIKPLVESTFIDGVLGGIGGFGGMFMPDLSNMKQPVFVSGADGVGTKLKLAVALDKHDTVGIDCVAMCVNDIACSGADPLFFLDYIALGKNKPELVEQIVSGVADGCRQAGCALIGGETAEMPGFYPENEYDMAGFAVGMVDHDSIIDGSDVQPGDMMIGLSSNGLHSNGFSLIRKLFGEDKETLSRYIPELSTVLGEELLKPTRIYVKALKYLRSKVTVKAMSHITGGGFIENLPRMLPPNIKAAIKPNSYPKPPIFDLIMETGSIPVSDMYNTFNMGIGMVIVVSKADVGLAMESLILAGERPYAIGSCREGKNGVELW